MRESSPALLEKTAPIREEENRPIPPDEVDENLTRISSLLFDMKGIATGLGTEIQSQTKTLEDIHQKTDKTNVKIRSQTRKLGKFG